MTHRLTRRQMLRLVLMSGASSLIAACAGGATKPVAQSQPTLPVPTAAPVMPTARPAAPTSAPTTAPQAAPTAAAQAAPTAAPQPTAVVTPSPPPVTLAPDIGSAATQFLASLDQGARTKATYPFGDSERQRWHWTTPGGFPRNGLPLREMNPDQRTLALDLLRASLSEAGYQKTLDIISLQNELGNDPELYFVTVFGTPGGAEPWGWRFEGHHVSRHFTIVGEQVAATPLFNGAWPNVTDAGLRAMAREEDAARELITSLDEATRAVALFQARTLTNHVTQNQAYVAPLDPVGISAADLAPDQQNLVLEIIQTYLGVLPESIATPGFEQIRGAGLETIRFGWAGNLEPRRPHYYRIQGPTFLLEFDNSRNGGTHIHSVWRDFATDFGQHLQ